MVRDIKDAYISAFNVNIRQEISYKERVHAKDSIYQIFKNMVFPF